MKLDKPALICKTVQYPCGCIAKYTLVGSTGEKHTWRGELCTAHKIKSFENMPQLEAIAEQHWQKSIEDM